MHFHYFSTLASFNPFTKFRKRSSRDVHRLQHAPPPMECGLLLRVPRGLSASPVASSALASGRVLSRLPRWKRWRDRVNEGALVTAPFLAISAVGGLLRFNFHLILFSILAVAVPSELRKIFFIAGVLSVGIHHPALAEQSKSWSGNADIIFEGTSTLHNWGGKLTAKPFKTQVTLNADGKPKRVKAEVILEAAKMDTAEPKRDENMRKAMKVTDHPFIQAAIDVPADKIAADLNTPTQLPMTLTLLGKPQQITGAISHFQRKDGKVTFELDFSVSMKVSGISVPSVLLFIRVGDAVKVHASVTLTQS